MSGAATRGLWLLGAAAALAAVARVASPAALGLCVMAAGAAALVAAPAWAWHRAAAVASRAGAAARAGLRVLAWALPLAVAGVLFDPPSAGALAIALGLLGALHRVAARQPPPAAALRVLPLATCGLLLAPHLVRVLCGPRWHEAVLLSQLALAAGACAALGTAWWRAAPATLHARWPTAARLSRLGVLALGLFGLAPRYGMLGVGLAVLAAAGWGAAMALLAARAAGLGAVLRSAIAAAAAAAALRALQRGAASPPDPGFDPGFAVDAAWLAGGSVVAATVFLAVLALLWLAAGRPEGPEAQLLRAGRMARRTAQA